MTYNEICKYEVVDGSTTELEGTIDDDKSSYVLKMEDITGMHKVGLNRPEAQILIDELLKFVSFGEIELDPDMTLNDAAIAIWTQEFDIWDWYVDGFTGNHKGPDKVTLRDVSTLQGFVVCVERGSSEGIYMTIKGIDEDGKLTTAIVGKTLEDPNSDRWYHCWLSGGRVARALDNMRW